MKRELIIIISVLAFIFSGNESHAQDTKNASPEYYTLDQAPTFQGGSVNSFARWVVSNLEYPTEAKKHDITGTVLVRFTVSRKGFVEDVHIERSVHPLLDEEAVRVVSKSPEWKPAIKDGYTVPVSYTLPVIFNLTD